MHTAARHIAGTCRVQNLRRQGHLRHQSKLLHQQQLQGCRPGLHSQPRRAGQLQLQGRCAARARRLPAAQGACLGSVPEAVATLVEGMGCMAEASLWAPSPAPASLLRPCSKHPISTSPCPKPAAHVNPSPAQGPSLPQPQSQPAATSTSTHVPLLPPPPRRVRPCRPTILPRRRLPEAPWLRVGAFAGPVLPQQPVPGRPGLRLRQQRQRILQGLPALRQDAG